MKASSRARSRPTSGRRLVLPKAVADAVVAWARSAAPEECCGVLLGERRGRTARVVRAVPGANEHPGDRRRAYSIAVADLLAAERRGRADGLEVVGYYHSHPTTPPRPSAADRRSAWHGMSYLIVGFERREGAPAAHAALSSWCFDAAGGVEEERVETIGGPAAGVGAAAPHGGDDKDSEGGEG